MAKYIVHSPKSSSHTSHRSKAMARDAAQIRADKYNGPYFVEYVARRDVKPRHIDTVYPKTGNPTRRRSPKRKNDARRNAGTQSKLLKNFTGVVRLNKDKTVSIIGTGKKSNPGRNRARRKNAARRRARR